MAWVRDGGAPEEIKVSFVVNKADHPELVEWLWGLPFRKQSAVIRDILSEATKIVSSNAEPARSAVPRKPVQKVKEAPKENLPVTPAVQVSNATPHSSTSMTEATAAILRNMQADF